MFQTRKVFDHQNRRFGVIMHFLTVYQALNTHTIYTVVRKKMAVTPACLNRFLKNFCIIYIKNECGMEIVKLPASPRVG